MRLLHVFPSFEVGGQQMRAVALANGMASDETCEEVENLVLSLNGDFTCAEKFSNDVVWEPANTLSGGDKGIVRRLLDARALIESADPDVVVTYNWGAIEWAAANLLPSLVPGVKPLRRHIHIDDGFGPEEADGQLRRRVLFRRLVLSRHARIVFPSRTLYRVARDVWRLPVEHLDYIPNGIDLGPYGGCSRQEAREVFDLPRDKLVIGTLATLRPEKNLKRLIEVFRDLRESIDCHLVIAGEGRERKVLEARVRELDLSDAISFPGFIETPHTILPAFDIFALSSDTEQMPLSIIEAMAAGLPIASLDVGDIRQMVAQESRAYVSGRDKTSLATSLRALLEAPHVRELCGQANRTLAKSEFGAEKMLASWKNLFIYG